MAEVLLKSATLTAPSGNSSNQQVPELSFFTVEIALKEKRKKIIRYFLGSLIKTSCKIDYKSSPFFIGKIFHYFRKNQRDSTK